ncbi:MAG: aspartate--tRNA ligase, partial [Myxococcota bacterium]
MTGGSELDGMATLRRSHRCGVVTADQIGTEVTVAGWVHRRRDHGGVIFVDLRDDTGLVQVVFRPEVSRDSHAQAGEIRSEYVLAIRGEVSRRSVDTVNPKMPTGEIEIVVREIRLLNRATPPPFAIEEDPDVDEATRLRYRIHDLRRPPLQRNLRLRSRLYQSVRRVLEGRDFVEIETPILAKATPEGARDFLVPSRLQPGEFYALPQSPQLMKQLLMVSGFDRYYQIVRCFRDEDGRADRQLEFTQVDLEMAFVGVEDVLEVLEELTQAAFHDVIGVEVARPFKRISYNEAMARYGSDRPDTRVQLELVELSDAFAQSDFRAFRSVVDKGGIVKCLPIHDAQALSRGAVDRLEKFVKKELGAKGLAWIRVNDDGSWQSPIVKFFSDTEREVITERTGA